MANKNEWKEPAKDENYVLDVMTIAPMNEIPRLKKTEWTKTTGKEAQTAEITVNSEDLDMGVTIKAESGLEETISK